MLEVTEVMSKADAWDVLVAEIRARWKRGAGEFSNVSDSVVSAIDLALEQVRSVDSGRPAYQQLLTENFDTEQYGLLPQLAGRLAVLDALLQSIESLEADIARAGG